MDETNDKQMYLDLRYTPKVDYEAIKAALKAKSHELEPILERLKTAGRVTRETLDLTFNI